MIEKTAVFARYLLQPTESLDNGLAMEALVFPAYPIGKHHVQVIHHFDKLGLAKRKCPKPRSQRILSSR